MNLDNDVKQRKNHDMVRNGNDIRSKTKKIAYRRLHIQQNQPQSIERKRNLPDEHINISIQDNISNLL